MTDSLSAHNDYGSESLTESEVDPDPFTQFTGWLRHAEAEGVYEPNAMVLATIDPDGRASARTVLLRAIRPTGIEFFTDYGSRKGRALAANPSASAVFPWYRLHRQVIFYGAASRVSAEESNAYFASRPHGSQVAALASEQSQVIGGRDALEARVRELEDEYPDGSTVPRPSDWGGFLLEPQQIEFWQGRTSRLHDRIRYTAQPDGSWLVDRLQP